MLVADWVLPVSGPAIRLGAVEIEDDRIAWVGPESELTAARAAAARRVRGILLPGLVNAHTHLQYTGFAELGRGGYRSFEHWSEEFEVRYQEVAEASEWRDASRAGARAALRSGTTSAADIVTDDTARGALDEVGLGGIEYLEAIAETESRWEGGRRQAFLDRLAAPHAGAIGISPHAPYSLDGAVIAELAEFARARGLRLHSHVAESAVEAALYATGRADVLEIYGALREEFALVRDGGAGSSTARYAASVGLLGPDSHIAHGIYLDADDRELLRETGTRVALCPRSNAVIGLEPPPVAAYLDEGHELAVGTDSLASAPSLDLLADVAELAAIARRQGYRRDDLDTRLVEAATRGGALALGLDDAGALEPGFRADLAVFAVEADESPERALVERGAGRCILTVVGGTTRFDASDSQGDAQ